MRSIYLPLAAAVLLSSAVSLSAEYVLVLKNGRQITVQSYREEGSMIKFQGFGGEIGISKDQLQTINKLSGARGLDVAAPERSPATAARETAAKSPPEAAAAEEPGSSDEEREREEREYQQKLREVTEQLREARERYLQSVRGTASRDATQLLTEDQIRAHSDDVTSRFKDALNNPSPPAPVNVLRPSPFSSLPPSVEKDIAGQAAPAFSPPPPYTQRERELSDLRRTTVELEKERERLINEMRQKNLNSGAMFLE